jgi:rhomboid protease GluP
LFPSRSYSSTIRSSWILVAVIVAGYIIGVATETIVDMHACQNISPLLVGPNCPSLLNFLVQQNSLVVYNHAYFELFTSIFVTNSDLDALLNALAVIILDLFVSNYFNRTRYFAIFFSTALFGNLLSLLQGPLVSSAGASGGIFGLYAASFSFNWAEQKRIDKTTLTVFVVIFLASSLATDISINWVAHLGGSVAGFVAGPLLYYSLRNQISEYSLTTERSKNTKVILALIALLVVGSIAQFLLFAL